jgi:hypothetical protein
MLNAGDHGLRAGERAADRRKGEAWRDQCAAHFGAQAGPGCFFAFTTDQVAWFNRPPQNVMCHFSSLACKKKL